MHPPNRIFGLLLFLATLVVGCFSPDQESADAAEDNNPRVAQLSKVETTDAVLAHQSSHVDQGSPISHNAACDNADIISAYNQRQSDRQVKGCGTVIKLLPDDNEGSRHQKFLVRVAYAEHGSPHTILIAHNIDLAPRLDGLAEGEEVMFYGEYEYNDKGGLVHWTHHDPAARHQNGWLEYAGQRYQ